MSKKHNYTYEYAKTFLYDKDRAITSFLDQSFNKTISMFRYSNLPETIPQKELEMLLQRKGHCIIAEVDGKLYALSGGFSGEPDVYGNPTQYTVANVALNLTKTFTIGIDCILIKNDFSCAGLYPIFNKYGVEIVDTEITLDMASVLMRIPYLISAPDDKTKASAELFLQRVDEGRLAIIGETPFFDGIKTQSMSSSNSRYISQLIELMQYYKASFYNDLGLNANYNMKRERLTESEVGLNIDVLLPMIDEMYSERVEGIENVNSMFSTDIVVDYNSTWKTTHESEEKETEFNETEVVDTLIENLENQSQNDAIENTETIETNEENEAVEESENTETIEKSETIEESETSENDETTETDEEEEEREEKKNEKNK